MSLVQLHAEHLPDQRGITDLIALPQRQRRHLRIEHRRRRCAAQMKEDFQILLPGMQQLGHGRVVDPFQQRVQRRQRHWIDARHPVGAGNLDQAELRIVGLFADEFSIQRQLRRALQTGAEVSQSRLIRDVEIVHSRRQIPDFPPVFSSRPMSVMVIPRSTALHMS